MVSNPRGWTTPRVDRAAYIAGFGSALPGGGLEQSDIWEGCFARHFQGDRVAERIFLGAGVRRRHAAVDPLVEDISGWGTGDRMGRYVSEALPLGKEAVAGALADAGLAPGDVGLFAVASCTGYATPGLDIRLASDLGMARTCSGCWSGTWAATRRCPGSAAVSRLRQPAAARPSLLCCELTSLHVQPPRPTSSRWSRTRCSPTPPRRSSLEPGGERRRAGSAGGARHRALTDPPRPTT